MAEKWSGMRNNFDVLINQATEEYSNFIIILDSFSVGWMDTFIPSVFPHDLYPTKHKASSAELLFKQLCLVEEAFQQKREKDLN